MKYLREKLTRRMTKHKLDLKLLLILRSNDNKYFLKEVYILYIFSTFFYPFLNDKLNKKNCKCEVLDNILIIKS